MRLKNRRILASVAVALCIAPAVALSKSTDLAPQTRTTLWDIPMSADLFAQCGTDHHADVSGLSDLPPENGYVGVPDTKHVVHPPHDVSFALLQSEPGFAGSMPRVNHVDPAMSAAIFGTETSR